MSRFVVFFALLAVSFCSWAQTSATLTGKITSASEPVPGATIHILNTNFGTASNSDGTFELATIIPGTYRIQISAVGYVTVEQSISIEANSSLNVELKESTTQLDAVVVTAQKTEEELQKIPVSISSISSRQVQQYRLWNSKDITAITPNLYSSNSGDNRNVTSIRGIATTSYDPSVATYIDGVNQFGLDTYIAQLSDVERIEVLRGPQGTLYGRNAMGGVINIITKQPTNKTTGFGEVNVGNYGQQRYSLGFRTPLIKDKLFLGISGMYDRTNGFYTNEFDNSHFDKKSSVLGNYYLKYIASPAWAFTLNVKHNQNRNNGPFTLSPSVEDAFASPFKLNQNAITTMTDNIFNSSFSANYSGRQFNFSSQTTYQSNYRFYQQPIDGDFSPYDAVTIINDYGKDWNHVKVGTQEFKFTSPASSSSPFQWTAGTYMYHQNNPVKQATHFGEDAGLLGAPDTNFSTINTFKGKSSGIAVYGQGTYHITDRFDVIGGLRYDYEHKKQSVLGEFQKDAMVFETQPDTSATASFSAVSPKLGFAFQAKENINLYATYSRGFRAGGLTTDPALYPYKPEYSSNMEFGVKQTYWDNRVRFNASVFYIKASDVQVPTLVLPEAITITRNAGELTSKGIEAEISTTLTKGLQLDYNFGLTDATYKTLNVPQQDTDGNPVVVSLKGNRQIYTPKSTSMLALQYSLSLGTSLDLKLIVRGEWMYIGMTYFDLGNTISQDAYNLLNTRVGLAAKGFEVMFWGRNMGDQKYVSYAYDFGAAHLGDPKNYGLTIRKSF
ncbi:MAG TPA: TonB-dependent receptor [Cyclobacteriaceae bacterium]